MKTDYVVDPEKIESVDDLIKLAKFVLTHSKLKVASSEVDIESIKGLLRKIDNGTGN